MSAQHDFAQALLDPALPCPAGLVAWNGSNPARRTASTKAARTRTSRASPSATGGSSSGACGIADGATVCQPPSSGASSAPPSHGDWLEALRPAWPSWMPIGIAE